MRIEEIKASGWWAFHADDDGLWTWKRKAPDGRGVLDASRAAFPTLQACKEDARRVGYSG